MLESDKYNRKVRKGDGIEIAKVGTGQKFEIKSHHKGDRCVNKNLRKQGVSNAETKRNIQCKLPKARVGLGLL